jgi:selenide,water dikinase
MLRASKLSAEIEMDLIPMLDGCQELIESGIQSTLAPDNRLVAGKVQIDVMDIESNRVAGLFDPQTSGGLLFGVRPEESQRVLSFLADNDFGRSAVVGEVIENTGNMPSLKIR